MKNKIAIILTCFNRKNITLSCLSALEMQKNIEDVDVDIYLVDDGSTDGTGESVSKNFPKVNLIKGSGDLYWNGGMRLAWESSLKVKPNFYLWINDDSFLYENAISNLLKCFDKLIKKDKKIGVLLGSMVDPKTKELTYGGRQKSNSINPLKIGPVVLPKSEPQKCNFINGNLILVPSSTVEKIGILSDRFTHSMGDFDYGLRAIKAGLDCWVAPGVYGECNKNPIEGTWQDKSLGLNERIQKTKNITQLPPIKEWKYFVKTHGGPFWWLLYIDAFIRDKYPQIWFILKRKI
jgi:GT2 family glycosyltransferase